MTLINPQSKITLGLVCALAVAGLSAGGFVWRLKTEVDEVEHAVERNIQTFERGLGDIRKDFDVMMNDRYSLPMAEADALRQAIENPGHRVPDPRNPGQVIVVDVGGMFPDGTRRTTP